MRTIFVPVGSFYKEKQTNDGSKPPEIVTKDNFSEQLYRLTIHEPQYPLYLINKVNMGKNRAIKQSKG